MGVQKTHTCMDPRLKEFLAGELQKAAAVMKERRKAREERTQAPNRRRRSDSQRPPLWRLPLWCSMGSMTKGFDAPRDLLPLEISGCAFMR